MEKKNDDGDNDDDDGDDDDVVDGGDDDGDNDDDDYNDDNNDYQDIFNSDLPNAPKSSNDLPGMVLSIAQFPGNGQHQFPNRW